MPICETCGNDYDKAFEIRWHDGRSLMFDSFECAIQALAPACEACGTTIIGHGMEANGSFYCCAHCAAQAGVTALDDRVG